MNLHQRIEDPLQRFVGRADFGDVKPTGRDTTRQELVDLDRGTRRDNHAPVRRNPGRINKLFLQQDGSKFVTALIFMAIPETIVLFGFVALFLL